MNTMFLATVVGWYMVIFGLLMLSRQELMTSVFSEIMAQKSLFFMLAFITLLVGLLLVASHNIWVMDWPVSLTVFGWCILGGALIRLFFLEFMLKAGRSFKQTNEHDHDRSFFSRLWIIPTPTRLLFPGITSEGGASSMA